MGILDRFKSKPAKLELDVGDDVEYRVNGKWYKGVVHGVRNYEDGKTGKTVALSYLVDNGKNEHVHEIVTPEDEDNIKIRQPKQVEVTPDNIRQPE